MNGSIYLPCGFCFNGTVGELPRFKARYKLHKKKCETCKACKSNELNDLGPTYTKPSARKYVHPSIISATAQRLTNELLYSS